MTTTSVTAGAAASGPRGVHLPPLDTSTGVTALADLARACTGERTRDAARRFEVVASKAREWLHASASDVPLLVVCE